MIIVDDRIGGVECDHALRTLGIPTMVYRLEFGDFSFSGLGPNGQVMVGIERKKVRDYMACVRDKRFAGHQLIGMMRTYDFKLLIIEGPTRPGDNGDLEEMVWDPAAQKNLWKPVMGGYTYREFDNSQNTLALHTDLKIKRSVGEWDTAHQIVDLYKRFTVKWSEHQSHLGFASTDEATGVEAIEWTKPGIVRRVANQFKGVGWKRSAAVAVKFATVREMVNADVKVWEEIEGIGKKGAQSIVKEIGG